MPTTGPWQRKGSSYAFVLEGKNSCSAPQPHNSNGLTPFTEGDDDYSYDYVGEVAPTTRPSNFTLSENKNGRKVATHAVALVSVANALSQKEHSPPVPSSSNRLSVNSYI